MYKWKAINNHPNSTTSIKSDLVIHPSKTVPMFYVSLRSSDVYMREILVILDSEARRKCLKQCWLICSCTITTIFQRKLNQITNELQLHMVPAFTPVILNIKIEYSINIHVCAQIEIINNHPSFTHDIIYKFNYDIGIRCLYERLIRTMYQQQDML